MKTKLYFSYEKGQGQIIARVDDDKSTLLSHLSKFGKIILLGRQECIDVSGYFVADLIEKERCFIAINAIKQKPKKKTQETQKGYFPNIRTVFYTFVKNTNLSDLREVSVFVKAEPIFYMEEKMLPYKNEILAFYQEQNKEKEAEKNQWQTKILSEEVLPKVIFGNINEDNWGFYKEVRNRVYLYTIPKSGIMAIGLGISEKTKNILEFEILRKKLLRTEKGMMVAEGIIAAFHGLITTTTENPVYEYVLKCAGKIILAQIITIIRYDSNEEKILSQKEISEEEWVKIKESS